MRHIMHPLTTDQKMAHKIKNKNKPKKQTKYKISMWIELIGQFFLDKLYIWVSNRRVENIFF